MTESEPWQRLRELFHRALDEPVAARQGFVERACDGEPELARELLALLAAHDQASDFLESGVAGAAPELAELWDAAVAGSRIGPYRVIRELGRGGMGAVYLARRDDDSYRQEVAIKLIKRGMDTGEILRRFLAERQILANLAHPHIARLLDGGSTSDGRPFLVLEFIDGQPIDAYCRDRRMGLEGKLRLFLAVAHAVAFAHQHLVVHRDLKPANILVGGDGAPKLLDFGIAKLLGRELSEQGATQVGSRPRTPDYASPEQLEGGAITTATDVYGLGLLLYELATGIHPLRASSDGRMILASAAVLASGGDRRLARRLRGELDAILATALAREPAERYPSARELAHDVERYLARVPVNARRPTPLDRLSSFVRRHKLASAAALALAALGLTAMVLAVALGRERIQVEAQSRRSEALASFLTDVFKVADPSVNRGATVTARELLETGTRQLLDEGRSRPPWLEAGSLEPATRAYLLDRVGVVHQNLGLFAEAERVLTRSLALQQSGTGPEAALALTQTQMLLAAAMREQGKLSAAEELLAAALATRRRELGAGSLAAAATLTQLGLVDQYQKDFDQGRGRLREAIALQRRAGGAAELDLAESLSTLATLEIDAERPEAAEPLLAEALAIDRRSLGEDHPRTIVDLANLAGASYGLGDLEAAQGLTREVLRLRRRVLGEVHPEVAETYLSLSTIAWARNDLGGAEQAAREAVAIDRQAGPVAHPLLARSLTNLGTISTARGALDGAEEALREALLLYRQNPDTPPATVANCLNSLAQVERERGHLAQAEKLLRQALELWQGSFGPESLGGASSLNSLGGVLLREGRLAEAERAYREALAVRRKLLPEGHPDLAHSLVGLGRLKLAEGLPREAEPLLSEALELRRLSLPAGHALIAQAEAVLAECRAAKAVRR